MGSCLRVCGRTSERDCEIIADQIAAAEDAVQRIERGMVELQRQDETVAALVLRHGHRPVWTHQREDLRLRLQSRSRDLDSAYLLRRSLERQLGLLRQGRSMTQLVCAYRDSLQLFRDRPDVVTLDEAGDIMERTAAERDCNHEIGALLREAVDDCADPRAVAVYITEDLPVPTAEVSSNAHELSGVRSTSTPIEQTWISS